MIVIVLAVLTINLLLHRPLIDSLLFAVALAVGLSPELLPAIMSVTLSAGARRMAERGVIVRRLEAIENLGSTDVLCTDKTGTLTKGVVELTAAVDAEGRPSDRVYRLAAVNALLETGIENPLDAAIVESVRKKDASFARPEKVDEIPYDFLRKRLTIVVEDDATSHTIVTKGAFDTVLGCCSSIATPGGPLPIDNLALQRAREFYEARGKEGYRVLGVASRTLPGKRHYDRSDETDMVFEGFLLFFDPLKEGIEDTIQSLTALGIKTKIISGDNRHVTTHVARAIGLDPDRLLTGQQLNEMREEALRSVAGQIDLFAEVDPQQKERIVRALQHGGHAVAYMGDGINDAPALNAADVGVSVDQAVDVARETADIVLLRRDLDVLRQGVVDGRRTFANTLKYIEITTSANFGNMISMALATVFVPFLPLLAKQILLNNFLSDIPSITISTDNVDKEATDSPQRWDVARIWSFMLVFGLTSTAFDLATFFILLHVFHAGEALFQSTWFVVSVLTELAVVLVLRTHLPAWRSSPSRPLLCATIAIFVVALCLPYIGIAASAFGFVPIPLHLLLAGFFIVALYVGTTEMIKWRYFGRVRGRR
jgi:Mg2+-importing ATPase